MRRVTLSAMIKSILQQASKDYENNSSNIQILAPWAELEPS